MTPGETASWSGIAGYARLGAQRRVRLCPQGRVLQRRGRRADGRRAEAEGSHAHARVQGVVPLVFRADLRVDWSDAGRLRQEGGIHEQPADGAPERDLRVLDPRAGLTDHRHRDGDTGILAPAVRRPSALDRRPAPGRSRAMGHGPAFRRSLRASPRSPSPSDARRPSATSHTSTFRSSSSSARCTWSRRASASRETSRHTRPRTSGCCCSADSSPRSSARPARPCCSSGSCSRSTPRGRTCLTRSSSSSSSSRTWADASRLSEIRLSFSGTSRAFPFFWTLRLAGVWAVALTALLGTYYFVERRRYCGGAARGHPGRRDHAPADSPLGALEPASPLRHRGRHGLPGASLP